MATEIESYEFGKKGRHQRAYHSKYDWKKWFGDPVHEHKIWVLTQAVDFPGTEVLTFQQTIRNAAGARKIRYRTERKDSVTVILEVMGMKEE